MRTDVLKPQEIFYKVVRYEVPAFQRRYIWTKENQWEPLWEDVSEKATAIIEDGQADGHFMGAIVLQQRPTPTGGIETRIVVDGQQRLTTLQLLIDAIQEVCEQGGHRQSAARLSRLVLNEKDYLGGNPELEFKVWPTINDRVAFLARNTGTRASLGRMTTSKRRLKSGWRHIPRKIISGKGPLMLWNTRCANIWSW